MLTLHVTEEEAEFLQTLLQDGKDTRIECGPADIRDHDKVTGTFDALLAKLEKAWYFSRLMRGDKTKEVNSYIDVGSDAKIGNIIGGDNIGTVHS